jgi:hypothetical protein
VCDNKRQKRRERYTNVVRRPRHPRMGTESDGRRPTALAWIDQEKSDETDIADRPVIIFSCSQRILPCLPPRPSLDLREPMMGAGQPMRPRSHAHGRRGQPLTRQSPDHMPRTQRTQRNTRSLIVCKPTHTQYRPKEVTSTNCESTKATSANTTISHCINHQSQYWMKIMITKMTEMAMNKPPITKTKTT